MRITDRDSQVTDGIGGGKGSVADQCACNDRGKQQPCRRACPTFAPKILERQGACGAIVMAHCPFCHGNPVLRMLPLEIAIGWIECTCGVFMESYFDGAGDVLGDLIKKWNMRSGSDSEHCPCCGSLPHVEQWRDTLNPNATWIRCDCGLSSATVYHEDPGKAKEEASRKWKNRKI